MLTSSAGTQDGPPGQCIMGTGFWLHPPCHLGHLPSRLGAGHGLPSMLQTGSLVVGHCCLLPWGQGSCPSSCLSNQPLSSEDLGALSGHCGQRLDGTQAILRGNTPPQTPGPFEEVGSRTPHHPASALTTSFGTAGGARVRLPPPRLDTLRAEDRGCRSWGGGGTQACTCLGTDSCRFL